MDIYHVVYKNIKNPEDKKYMIVETNNEPKINTITQFDSCDYIIISVSKD